MATIVAGQIVWQDQAFGGKLRLRWDSTESGVPVEEAHRQTA
jgi:hypothetical protein